MDFSQRIPPVQNMAMRLPAKRSWLRAHHAGKSRNDAIPGSTAPSKLPMATS